MHYATEWRMNLEDAEQKASLEIGDVCKTYLFLKWSGLTQKQQDDIRLKLDGDLSKFEEMMALVQRLAKHQQAQSHPESFYQSGDDEAYWQWHEERGDVIAGGTWQYVEDGSYYVFSDGSYLGMSGTVSYTHLTLPTKRIV